MKGIVIKINVNRRMPGFQCAFSYIIHISLRERLRCFSFANNRLEMCNELIGNTQVVRESWLHEKVS